VQDVYAAKAYFQADKAMVITASEFSREAIKLAKELFIDLWDGEYLKNELKIINYVY
jgi:HJR/Mrr/RecB family endonuclease